MRVPQSAPSFSAATRLVHAGLALAVISQLVTSLSMDPDEGGDGIFAIHQYGGLIAFAFVFLFWANCALRRRGTPLGQLVPWFSSARLASFGRDLAAHLRALSRMRMPEPSADTDSFASAIHGLGLLLMTAMATSGVLYYIVNTGDPDAGGLVGVAMLVHTTLANLVWAYLIGHAAMAVLHHFAGRSLGRMWAPGGAAN
jgi:cytochrome b561